MTEGSTRYDWERFWIAPSARLAMGTDEFFPDPLAEMTWMRPSIEASQLSELGDQQCLVLLGEPGLGKSQAIRDMVADAAEAPERPLLQRVDLGGYPDAGALRTKLIEAEDWRTWIAEGRTFHLFLDSLDEAMLHFPGIHKFLLSELEEVRGSLGRLRLRIACRSADWLPDLTAGLREIWPTSDDPAVRELSLAPLREVDARRAAECEGIDPDRFIVEVRERDLEGLASLPLTLKMLLAAAVEEDELPPTRAALYEKGVLQLLEEPDPSRRIGERARLAGLGERLAVAERVATSTLLSRRSGVTLAAGRAGPTEVDLLELRAFDARDRLGGAARPFEVTEEKIVETLRTALFTQAVPGVATFAHRGLSDYCAGASIASANLTDEGLSRLLFASGDQEGRLVPELREVAAWAAALSRQILKRLLAVEPEVLLRVDRLELDDAQRAEVVEAILNVESAERLERWDRRIWRNLSALNHPTIADQLNPLISDDATDWSLRRWAITIAQACNVRDCETVLLELALDDTQPSWVRDDGVWAIREYGSLASRRALVPLALERIDDDDDDEIKGSALAAVFPDLISAAQVFKVITPPRNRHLIGAYSSFLHHGLPQALGDDDLPTAIQWSATLAPVHRPTDNLYALSDAILCRAWSRIPNSEEIASLIAAVVLGRLKSHAGLLSSSANEDPKGALDDSSARRRLIEELAPSLRSEQGGAVCLVTTSPQLLRPEDLSWALARLETAVGTDTEAIWADIVRFSFSPPIANEQLEALHRISELSGELSDRVGHWFEPIELDSELAGSLRENERANAGADSELRDQRSEIDEEIVGYLDAAESGDADAWWRLNVVLQFDEYGHSFSAGELEADLTLTPGWQRSSTAQRLRMIAAAKAYLEGEPTNPESWFDSHTIDRQPFAGYRALHLLAKTEPDGVSTISAGTWGRWMSIVVAFPIAYPSEGRLHAVLLDAAAKVSPDEFTQWVDRKITTELADGEGGTWFVRRLGSSTPMELVEKISTHFADPAIDPVSANDLLGFLLLEDSEAGLAVARDWLGRSDSDLQDVRIGKVVATIATRLLADRPGLAWPEVSGLFDSSPAIGKEAFLELAHGERNNIASEMPDEDLAQLVAWAFRTLPESSDPPMEAGAHFVSPLESGRRLRDGILVALAARGTFIAVEAIEDLYATYETHSLRFALRNAKDARRSQTPSPSPADVVRIVSGSDAKPRTSADLAERVQTALSEVGRLVQVGLPPLAPELWNTRPVNTPKDEGHLSNWLVGQLKNLLGPSYEVTRESLVRGGGKDAGRAPISSSARRRPPRRPALSEY
jgi:hypothetical protein